MRTKKYLLATDLSKKTAAIIDAREKGYKEMKDGQEAEYV